MIPKQEIAGINGHAEPRDLPPLARLKAAGAVSFESDVAEDKKENRVPRGLGNRVYNRRFLMWNIKGFDWVHAQTIQTRIQHKPPLGLGFLTRMMGFNQDRRCQNRTFDGHRRAVIILRQNTTSLFKLAVFNRVSNHLDRGELP